MVYEFRLNPVFVHLVNDHATRRGPRSRDEERAAREDDIPRPGADLDPHPVALPEGPLVELYPDLLSRIPVAAPAPLALQEAHPGRMELDEPVAVHGGDVHRDLGLVPEDHGGQVVVHEGPCPVVPHHHAAPLAVRIGGGDTLPVDIPDGDTLGLIQGSVLQAGGKPGDEEVGGGREDHGHAHKEHCCDDRGDGRGGTTGRHG